MKIVGVVLTYNEAIHLRRCLRSLAGVCTDLVVVDCYSTDTTLEIAREFGATVLQREWINHAIQFNWALTQLDSDVDWVLRIDADEYLTPLLQDEVRQRLPMLPAEVKGIFLRRRICFMGRLIRHGGVFPVRILRLFRAGCGQSENRWMDEHIRVKGRTEEFQHELIDDNLNPLGWWVAKHNDYASREVVDVLNLEYGLFDTGSIAQLRGSGRTSAKRWIKEHVYVHLPGGLGPLLYFLYRYIFRLGFMDGREGTAFHVLQGFWYRYLVSVKLAEVRHCIRDEGLDVKSAIARKLGIKLP